MGLFGLFFGFKKHLPKKEDLIGNWEAVKLNDEPLDMHGFSFVRINISSGSIQITTELKTVGRITTESNGPWELKGNIFRSKIGDDFKESELAFFSGNLTFSPDPLFKEDAVFKSEYKKVI